MKRVLAGLGWAFWAGMVGACTVGVTALAALAAWGVCGGSRPASAPGQQVAVPVVMYHHLCTAPERLGDYAITPAELEQDLRYLQQQGYHTVVMADLIAYVHEGVPLPEKPIVLTFDDGYESNLVFGTPLLRQYGMQAVIGVVGEFADRFTKTEDHRVQYSHLTWPQIAQMAAEGVFEIQNHTYNLHQIAGGRRGCSRMAGEPLESYEALLRGDLEAMQQKLLEQTGGVATTFVYPYGSVCKESLPVVRQVGFLASLGAEAGINYLTGDPECLYGLHRYNRPHGTSLQQIAQKNQFDQLWQPLVQKDENGGEG